MLRAQVSQRDALQSPGQGVPAVVVACHAWVDDQIGGAFKVASEVAGRLAAAGHRVCYVCGTPQAVRENPSIVRGVELWRYEYPRRLSPHPANLIGHVRETCRLTKSIAGTGPILCLNGHSPLQFLGGALAVGKSCARRVYTVHSPFDEEIRAGWSNTPISAVRRIGLRAAAAIDRANCRRATNVQTLSQYTLDLLRDKYPQAMRGKGIVCPGWVDTRRFHPAPSRQAARGKLDSNWHTDLPVFFTVRRLEPRMGLDHLIEAVHALSRSAESPDFRLIIGGAGSQREALERQVRDLQLADRVFFTGRITDDRLPDCFAAADCFVLPTAALECFGLIVLESFASGTPVIATPVGAIPELIAGERRRWLTAGTAAGQIAERMRDYLTGRLVDSPERLRALAETYDVEIRTAGLTAALLGDTIEPVAAIP